MKSFFELTEIGVQCLLEHSYEVGVKALESAIHIYTKSLEIDGEHLSRCYHSLVQMVMLKEEVGEKGEEGQAWRLFNQILDLLESKAKVCVCKLIVHACCACRAGVKRLVMVYIFCCLYPL